MIRVGKQACSILLVHSDGTFQPWLGYKFDFSLCFRAASTAASSVPTSSVTDGLPPPAPVIPQMSAWRQAQELTRKAEEEAMLAEKKSQEAYVWCVNLIAFRLVHGLAPATQKSSHVPCLGLLFAL